MTHVDGRPRGLRVLHVTESMASGVMFAMHTYINEQAALGATIEVMYLRRPDSPDKRALDELFAQASARHEFSSRGRIGNLLLLARAVYRRARADPSLIVHVHSSLAGAVVRLAAAIGRFDQRTFYSPHGFAFLREDMHPLARRGFQWVERGLSRFTRRIVVVSASEHELCTALGIRNAVVVENGVDLQTLDAAAAAAALLDRPKPRRPQVVTAARITPQKGPVEFARIASTLRYEFDFTWIGAAPSADEEGDRDTLLQSGVTVTGWLSKDEVLVQLACADVYLSTAAWEGMPLALIEAQCLGIPAVVFDCVGNRDTVSHEGSGLIVRDSHAAIEALSALASDRAWLESLSTGALAGRERFDSRRIGVQLIATYEETS